MFFMYVMYMYLLAFNALLPRKYHFRRLFNVKIKLRFEKELLSNVIEYLNRTRYSKFIYFMLLITKPHANSFHIPLYLFSLHPFPAQKKVFLIVMLGVKMKVIITMTVLMPVHHLLKLLPETQIILHLNLTFQ